MIHATSSELRMELPASPAASGLARTLVEQRLAKWDILGIRDDVLLVVAEFVTNACAETPFKAIAINLIREPASVLVEVWDGGAGRPRLRAQSPLTLDALDAVPDEAHWDHGGGWGLPLVQALSTACGTREDPAGGKWVWSRLATPAPRVPSDPGTSRPSRA
ncbi:anti-sigma regulatory factor (Ser/Thr protein kinase) [Actinocorallia herbida]|uniref:Anti-sigma regulatory factor (Ser/Thr protein kinase) n=1 Tax=Actinocorallia herbida TaxID=58109 RepID=A0A3N1D7Y4_9ACTN|nr:ATP-binding protein [Actinocorallia herbida]ROO89642.1 anti-sigma regulatory factor (Ser/Thr protein kinase) [Actinocorallia herbida]